MAERHEGPPSSRRTASRDRGYLCAAHLTSLQCEIHAESVRSCMSSPWHRIKQWQKSVAEFPPEPLPIATSGLTRGSGSFADGNSVKRSTFADLHSDTSKHYLADDVTDLIGAVAATAEGHDNDNAQAADEEAWMSISQRQVSFAMIRD